MSTKIKVTVTDALNHYPHLARVYCDVLVAAAFEINDAVSQRVIRAHNERARVDCDDEVAFDRCIEEMDAAEGAFIARHENTVVSL